MAFAGFYGVRAEIWTDQTFDCEGCRQEHIRPWPDIPGKPFKRVMKCKVAKA
jgi:hypothetical protein